MGPGGVARYEADGQLRCDRTENFQHRPRAAAEIESADRRLRSEIVPGRPENLVGSAKGSDVKLGGEEVVAPLGRGQSLAGELQERRSVGMKQR